MSANIELVVDLSIVLCSFVIGVCQYRKLDKASKIILLLLLMILIDEIVAHFYSVKYHSNMVVYNSYSIVELFMLSIYFNQTIGIFRKKNIGIYIGGIGVIFGVFNFLFLQSINSFSTNYLLFEGFCVILMALVSFYYLLLTYDDLKLYYYPHFWFTSVLLFFWSVTYVAWGIFPIIHSKENVKSLELLLWLINIISYGTMALVFLFYPKMRVSHE